ncbi:MAG: hypothetical protein PXY39_12950, partial [archaeon]|nr:hypothetical protein [archaeon]
DPLTVCVTKIPKDDNHDFYLWRGLKVQAQCPECQLTDYYSNETTAYEMLSMHMANEHSYEHSRLSNKFERARWRNDFTSMKNNWV